MRVKIALITIPLVAHGTDHFKSRIETIAHAVDGVPVLDFARSVLAKQRATVHVFGDIETG